MIRHSRAGTVVAALGWTAIAFATLRNAPESGLPHSVFCLVCGRLGGADVLQNIILFLPLGAGLGMMKVSGARGMAFIVATTTAVEVLQATVLVGRFASLSDMAANSAGGALGLWVGWLDGLWAFPEPRTRHRLARASVAAMLLVLVAATAGLRRMVPPGPLALEIAPLEEHGRRFEGSVVASWLGGDPIAPGPLPSAVASSFRRNGFALTMSAVSGPWVEYESSIATVTDPHQRGLVVVSQDGRDAILASYVAGSRAGLRGPRLVLPRALPPHPGEAVMIDAVVTVRRVALTVRAGDRVSTRALTLGPSTAWMGLYPFGYSTSAIVTAVSIAWLAALTVPAGYWTGLTRVRDAQPGASRESPVPRRELATTVLCIAIATIIGLGIMPSILGFAPAALPYWIAPLGGFALGAGAGRIASRAVP